MSDGTGRYGVVRYAWHYEVIDKLNGNTEVFKAKSRDRVHRECDRLNAAHLQAQRDKYVH